ncbi:hypothetical protein [Deinococcus kurensis]|uniref:hypothetical protein n=1 Tax=Deinococcus kurensis TaxID=2662757 RepID=UPI0012D349E3|nr:hypothetical protein [Deinococcus kurensis]
MSTRYRWLTLGESYLYGPALGKGLDSRRGSRCRVVTLPRAGSKPANVQVEFEDGGTHVVPSGVLRKIRA